MHLFFYISIACIVMYVGDITIRNTTSPLNAEIHTCIILISFFIVLRVEWTTTRRSKCLLLLHAIAVLVFVHTLLIQQTKQRKLLAMNELSTASPGIIKHANAFFGPLWDKFTTPTVQEEDNRNLGGQIPFPRSVEKPPKKTHTEQPDEDWPEHRANPDEDRPGYYFWPEGNLVHLQADFNKPWPFMKIPSWEPDMFWKVATEFSQPSDNNTNGSNSNNTNNTNNSNNSNDSSLQNAHDSFQCESYLFDTGPDQCPSNRTVQNSSKGTNDCFCHDCEMIGFSVLPPAIPFRVYPGQWRELENNATTPPSVQNSTGFKATVDGSSSKDVRETYRVNAMLLLLVVVYVVKDIFEHQTRDEDNYL